MALTGILAGARASTGAEALESADAGLDDEGLDDDDGRLMSPT